MREIGTHLGGAILDQRPMPRRDFKRTKIGCDKSLEAREIRGHVSLRRCDDHARAGHDVVSREQYRRRLVQRPGSDITEMVDGMPWRIQRANLKAAEFYDVTVAERPVGLDEARVAKRDERCPSAIS